MSSQSRKGRSRESSAPLEAGNCAGARRSSPVLLAWMDVLEAYARDWDQSFEGVPTYFTQEFWYLLVNCLRYHWQGIPMTIGQACHLMRAGSNRTREARINLAVDDGYLEKVKSSEDRRTIILRPTNKLEEILRGHFERTLEIARAKMLNED